MGPFYIFIHLALLKKCLTILHEVKKVSKDISKKTTILQAYSVYKVNAVTYQKVCNKYKLC